MDHRTILDSVSRVRADGRRATALTVAADLGVDDPEVLEDIGDAIAELVENGRLRRVETHDVVGGVKAPFPTVSYEPPSA